MGALFLVALVGAAGVSFLLPLIPVNFSGNKIGGFLANAVVIFAALLLLRMFRK
jgi:hypothetical protein